MESENCKQEFLTKFFLKSLIVTQTHCEQFKTLKESFIVEFLVFSNKTGSSIKVTKSDKNYINHKIPPLNFL